MISHINKTGILPNIIYCMSSNTSFRNISIHSIIQQNDDLRRALTHARQNQLLLQQLLLKVEHYKANEIELMNLNTVLTEAVNAQKNTLEQKENAFQEEMQYVFSQHDKILFGKDQELKACLADLERLVERNRQTEEFVMASQERQRQLGENYERELGKYRQKIGEFESKLESVYRSSEKEKMAFEKTRSNWSIQQTTLDGQISNLTSIVKKLQADNVMLMDYSKDLQANLIKNQQQTKSTLITLRDKLVQQQSQIHNLLYLKNGLQGSNQIIAKELEDLKRKQAHLSSDNLTLTSQNQKIVNLLAESDKQSRYLREHITELELSLNKKVEKYELELQQLRKQKLELLRSKTEAESYANAKVAELRELSASVGKFQTLTNKQETHIKGMTADLQDLQLMLTKQKQRNSEQSIRIKQLQDGLCAVKVQNENYYSINNKLQLQLQQLQAEAMTLAKNSLSSKDINKEFIDQMNSMLVKFREERQEQSRLHVLQREKLKERYEFQLKQRELDLLKKISLLEEQLAISHKFEILSERNSNIYTFTTAKYDY